MPLPILSTNILADVEGIGLEFGAIGIDINDTAARLLATFPDDLLLITLVPLIPE
jgi:hypothetical protein